MYHVLTAISNDRNLMSWKQKTKISTMKKIRENHLLKYIPESETIQLVLKLYQKPYNFLSMKFFLKNQKVQMTLPLINQIFDI